VLPQSRRARRGQSIVEYLLIVVLVSLTVVFAINQYGATIRSKIDCATEVLSALVSGSKSSGTPGCGGQFAAARTPASLPEPAGVPIEAAGRPAIEAPPAAPPPLPAHPAAAKPPALPPLPPQVASKPDQVGETAPIAKPVAPSPALRPQPIAPDPPPRALEPPSDPESAAPVPPPQPPTPVPSPPAVESPTPEPQLPQPTAVPTPKLPCEPGFTLDREHNLCIMKLPTGCYTCHAPSF
jgi:Flp pilus assembly pilin Flp